MGTLAPTPSENLVDSLGRPYFLWDSDMTLDEFEAELGSEVPEARAFLVGKLMRQAKPDDVFTFVKVEDIVGPLATAGALSRTPTQLLALASRVLGP